MTILLVDDEPLVIQDIAAEVSWEALGIQHVLLAYNASQAMQEFEYHHIDLVICDVEMPQINGIQLLAWIKEHSPSTKSIILTCHPLFDYAKEAIRLNCIDYMLKPVDTDALSDLLRKTVEDFRRNSPLHDQENFWKQCSSGAYSSSSTLREAAAKYGILSQDAAYIAVLIRFTSLNENYGTLTEYSAQEKNIETKDKQLEALLSAITAAFADVKTEHLFFLDYTSTLFGIFSVSPKETQLVTELICYRLEETRYKMPGCISAFIKESRGILTTVRSFSQLRGISAQTEISCIRAAAELSVTTKLYFSVPHRFYSKFHKDEVLDEVTLVLSQLPADSSHRQEMLIEMRRELENWFFTVLSDLDVSPAEALQDQNISYLRRKAIIGQEPFLAWAQAILACLVRESRQNQQVSLAVSKAQEYINRNLHLNLSRKDVAKHVFLNVDYLDRCFRSELGVSISQYTLQKKLELAKELLIHTSKSISDIAAAVGYNNLSSFSYMFKHETGMTPMAYRRTPNTSC